jgi:type-F conjugative transfer system pilin assembly protein TrbC
LEKKKLLCDVKFSLKNNILIRILLIGLLSTNASAAPSACENVQLQKSCRTSSDIEPAHKNEFYQNSEPLDSFFTLLQKESLQKVEALQKNPVFQEIVAELQRNTSPRATTFNNSQNENRAELYIFISFSMGEKALLNLAHEAKRFGGTLVLRGFRDGNYVKTAQALQKIITKTGQGVLIDPELYTLFDVTAIPTFVLSKPFPFQAQERTQTPIHDKLQGHVSVQYALETFVKKGDLKTDARALLKRGAFQ